MPCPDLSPASRQTAGGGMVEACRRLPVRGRLNLRRPRGSWPSGPSSEDAVGSAERGQRLKCGAREATRRRSDAGSASHRRVAPHAPFQAFSSSSAFDSTDSLSPSPGSPGPKEAGWGRPGELGRCSGPALGGSEAAGGSRTGDLGPPSPRCRPPVLPVSRVSCWQLPQGALPPPRDCGPSGACPVRVVPGPAPWPGRGEAAEGREPVPSGP